MGFATEDEAWGKENRNSISNNSKFTKTFSSDQVYTAKMLMDLEQELNNKINFTIQESFLRKSLDNEILKTQIDCLEDSIKYVLENKIALIRNLLK